MQHVHAPGLGSQYDAIAGQLASDDRQLVEDLKVPVVSDQAELVEARILFTRLASYQNDRR